MMLKPRQERYLKLSDNSEMQVVVMPSPNVTGWRFGGARGHQII